MKTTDFDFELPPELIALRPAAQRDGSRLLVLRRTGGLEHRYFRDIGDYIESGDMLVLNDMDRFHLVNDVIDRVPKLGYIHLMLQTESVKRWLLKKII